MNKHEAFETIYMAGEAMLAQAVEQYRQVTESEVTLCFAGAVIRRIPEDERGCVWEIANIYATNTGDTVELNSVLKSELFPVEMTVDEVAIKYGQGLERVFADDLLKGR